MVSDEDKARLLRSVDVYVAPNTGGESFGIVLVEAMSAGAPVLASDLDAFRRVLDDGAAGELFPAGDAAALADAAGGAARRPGAAGRARATRARAEVRRYDWPVVAADPGGLRDGGRRRRQRSRVDERRPDIRWTQLSLRGRGASG